MAGAGGIDGAKRLQQNRSLVQQRTSFKDISDIYTRKNVYESISVYHERLIIDF